MSDSSGPPIVGWDANVWCSYLDQDLDRLPDIDALLAEARAKKLVIVTSTLSLVEVAYVAAERAAGALSAQAEADIDGLWTPGGVVRMVELSPVVSRRARGYIREAMVNKRRLTPRDAIQIASAVVAGAVAFHTYDTDLEKFSELAGIKISRPEAQQPLLFGGSTGAQQEARPEPGS